MPGRAFDGYPTISDRGFDQITRMRHPGKANLFTATSPEFSGEQLAVSTIFQRIGN